MKILNKHSGLLGQTQSGKSYFMGNFLFKNCNLPCIYINPKYDTYPMEYGKSINSVSEINFSQDKKYIINSSDLNFLDEFWGKYKFKKIPIVIFIDEVTHPDFDMSENKIPDTFKDIISMGLGLNKIMVWCTQRVNKTNNWLISQSNHFYMFYIDPSDVDYLRHNSSKYPSRKREISLLKSWGFGEYDSFEELLRNKRYSHIFLCHFCYTY